MSSTKGGLGRGLDHIFNSSTTNTEPKNISGEEIKNISIDKIQPNPNQPRRIFSDGTIEELSVSIKNQGVIQPLIVRKKSDELFEIIAGERRFRASKLAGITELPVIIRNYTDTEAITIALIENLQRENLNPIDEAKAYADLKELHKISQEELAEKLGKSRSAVANSIRLLTLPQYIKDAIIYDEIKSSHGRCLLSITDENTQNILFQAILKHDLNVREVEKSVEVWKQTNRLPEYMYENEKNIAKENRINSAKIMEKNPYLFELEEKLKQKFFENISVKGSESKGSIKINYKTEEELQNIVSILNL